MEWQKLLYGTAANLEEVRKNWADAQEAFNSGSLALAIAKATESKEKLAALETSLKSAK